MNKWWSTLSFNKHILRIISTAFEGEYAYEEGSLEVEEIEEFDRTTRGARDRETMRRMRKEYESHSLWYVVGTSLLFEGFILGIASIYFCRKDF